MTEIYTPKEWLSIFGVPSIIIDEKGDIYSSEEYKKALRSPMGWIDYENNNIYGKDFASLVKTPIAYMVRDNNVIKVYEYGKTQFSDPILFILDDKIYTYEEYTRWIGSEPGGYIRTDDREKLSDRGVRGSNQAFDGGGSASTNGGSGSGGGLAGDFLTVPIIIVFMIVFYIISNENRIASVAIWTALVMNMSTIIMLFWKVYKGKIQFLWDKKRFLRGVISGLKIYLLACVILVLLGIISTIGTGRVTAHATDIKMEWAAFFIGVPSVLKSLFIEK